MLGVALALIAAGAYGASDFAAGLGSRRTDPGAIAIIAQCVAVVAAAVAALLIGGPVPGTTVLVWGAVAGAGGGAAALALYRGLVVGRMNVVAPVSAVVTAALTAAFGIAMGDRLGPVGLIGLVAVGPALWMVTRGDDEQSERAPLAGVVHGVAAGVGFAILFVGFAQAGTDSGAWPVVSAEVAAFVAVIALGLTAARSTAQWRASVGPAVLVAIFGVGGNLAYLFATGHGSLTLVAVITALYPASTVLLARAVLQERWNRPQGVGLVLAAVAVACLTIAG